MTRKNMAERYATQRNRKVARRRALPRLGESESTVEENSELEFVEGDEESANIAKPTARQSAARMPRRVGRPSGLAAAANSQADYSYVRHDLRKIAITALTMLVLLIVLNVALQSLVR